MLPDWLKDLAAQCPEQDRRQLENTMHKNQVDNIDVKAPYDQVAADKRYRARQKANGIVRKTIRVPENRWEELQAIAKVMRDKA